MESVTYVQKCRDRNVPRLKRPVTGSARPEQLTPKSPVPVGSCLWRFDIHKTIQHKINTTEEKWQVMIFRMTNITVLG